jgi:hypothetical protein
MLAALELRQRRLLQGTLVGAVLIGAALLTAGGVMLRHRWVLARINDLRGVEAEVTSLQAEMAARKAVVDRLTASNANLTRALTTLRTRAASLASRASLRAFSSASFFALSCSQTRQSQPKRKV